jgi:hypothetical protein
MLSCGHFDFNFSKGRCRQCATIQSVQVRLEKEIIKEENISDLIDEADAIFSRYVRLAAADKDGIVSCYICDSKNRWQDSQCMHYIPRANLYTRFQLENCKAGCKDCNEYKGGNLIKYAERLEKETPGITESLYEQGHIVYRISREELRQIITEYSGRVNKLKRQ